MDNYISKNITFLVNKLGCSQDEFGALFDLNRGNINQYVKEKAQPKIDTIQKICKHFEISIDDFINRDLSEKGYTNRLEPASHFAEPTEIYGDKDKIIKAQEKTIATLEQHNETLKDVISNLKSKLGNAS